MTIVWKDEWSLGHELIDGDHKQLIAIINAAEEAINLECSRREIERILARLDAYAKYHFIREEAVQRAAGFPEQEGHHQKHIDLIKCLDKIRNRLRTAKDAYAYEDVVGGLAELLKDWLLHHVILADLRLKPYLKAMAAEPPCGPAPQPEAATPPAKPAPQPWPMHPCEASRPASWSTGKAAAKA